MTPAAGRTYALLLGAAAGLDKELASKIAVLEGVEAVDEIHVWASGEDLEAIRGLAGANSWAKVAAVTSARAGRDATIFAALTAISTAADDEDLILIVDSAHRSFTEATVSSCLSVAAEQGAAILASPVTGDVVHVDGSSKIHWLPPTDQTFVVDGPLSARFGRLFDLFSWASTIGAEAINEPYRWSLARLGAFVVAPTDRRE